VAADHIQIGEEAAAAGQKRMRQLWEERKFTTYGERIHHSGTPEMLAKKLFARVL
jgi:hypothetical protein